MALNNTLYHWGAIIVPVGYTDPLLSAAGGNPYGTSFVSGAHGDRPDEAILEAARYQGRRLATVAARLRYDGVPAASTSTPAAATVQPA